MTQLPDFATNLLATDAGVRVADRINDLFGTDVTIGCDTAINVTV